MTTSYATRGVGYSWTELRPTPGLNLFGGGGEQDGAVVAMNIDSRAESVQEEEARTLDTTGNSGNIDEAAERKPVDAANANKEFNFAHLKETGVDEMMQIDLTSTADGLSAGDVLVANDPRNATWNQTSGALESVVGRLYEQPNDKTRDTNVDVSYKTPNGGINPFAQKGYARSMVKPKPAVPTTKKQEGDDDGGDGAVERQAKKDGLGYYFEAGGGSGSGGDSRSLEHTQRNHDTGLRRTKTRKKDSELRAHLMVKNEIDDANNEAFELFKSERKGLKATLSDKEFDHHMQQIRNPMNTYTAVQTGVASTSQRTAKRYTRSQAGKLNQTLL